MFFLRRNLRPRRLCPVRPVRLPSRPLLEALEERITPTGSVNVSQLADGLGPNSLRSAVAFADTFNANGVYTINLTQTGTYNLTLQPAQGGGPLVVDNTANAKIAGDPSVIVIKGQGAGQTIINANFQYGAFDITSNTNIVFEDLTITGGKTNTNFGGAGQTITVNGASQALTAAGGGIYNAGGNVMLSNVNVSGCSATAPKAGAAAAGGGIFSSGGSLTFNNVVLNNNKAVGAVGTDYKPPVFNKQGKLVTPGAPGQAGYAGVGGGVAEVNTTVLTTLIAFDPTDLTTFPGAQSPLPNNFDPSVLTLPLLSVTNNVAKGGKGGLGGPSGGNSQASSFVSLHGGDGGVAQGGGLWLSNGTVNLNASTVNNNQAQAGAGGTVPVTAGKSDSGAAGGNGGAAAGGGIYLNAASTVTLSTSTVAKNTAVGGKGVNGSNGNDGARKVPPYKSHANGGAGGNGGNASGGGIQDDNASTAGSLTTFNATIAGNTAAAASGGNGGNGTTGGTNGAGGNGGNASGGGLAFSQGGAAAITNDTIAYNTAQGGAVGNQGQATKSVGNPPPPVAGSASGGGLFTSNGGVTIDSTIISQNHALGSGVINGIDAAGLTGTPAFSLIGGVPQIGTLSNNGGPTQTIALSPGSPALGAGDPSVLQAIGDIDQRGTFRGNTNDIGAYEGTPVPPPPPATFTFTVSNPGPFAATQLPATETVTATVQQNGAPVDGGTVAFTLFTPQGAPLSTDAQTLKSGNVFTGTLLITGNAPPGTYTIQAVYTTPLKKTLSSSPGTTSVIINQAPVNVTGITAVPGTFNNGAAQAVTLTATLTTPYSGTAQQGPVTEGQVVFTITGPDGKTYTDAANPAQVKNGLAVDTITIPSGAALGPYNVSLAYSDTATNYFLSKTYGQAAVFTVTAASGVQITGSASPAALTVNTTASQNVQVSANITNNNAPVNGGSATFALVGPGGTIASDPVPVTVTIAGDATDTLTVPAGTPSGTYALQVTYAGLNIPATTQLIAAALTIQAAPTTVTPNGASATASSGAQNVSVSAVVTSADGTVNSGLVVFTLTSGGAPVTVNGNPVQVSAGVSNGATLPAALVLPPGLPSGTYGITASYTDTAGLFASSSGTGALLVNPAPASPPPSPSPSPSPSPGASPPAAAAAPVPLLQAALALFIDGAELVLFHNPASVQQDIARNSPFAQPFSNLLVLAGEMAAFNMLAGV